MWRSIGFIFALFLLNIPVFAQTDTETLPFFYAYWFGPGDLDFHVMDALSGETLHSFESEVVDCPISLSKDGEWLVYKLADENLLQNLSTGEIFELEEGYIQSVYWNLDDDLVAFHYGYEADEQGIQVYELSSNSQIVNTQLNLTIYSSLDMMFDGTDFLYAFVNYYGTEIEFHRQNPSQDEVLYFPIDSFNDWIGLNFSPNERYLMAFGTNGSINLVDLTDGTISSLGETEGVNAVRWLPNEDATIIYISYDEMANIQLESYEVDSQESESIDGASVFYFSLSPDGSFAVYANLTGDFEYSWGIINTSNDESQVFASGADEVVWLSGSQFVYNSFNTENESIDLYFFDAITGESYQLTDTADTSEIFNCIEG